VDELSVIHKRSVNTKVVKCEAFGVDENMDLQMIIYEQRTSSYFQFNP